MSHDTATATSIPFASSHANPNIRDDDELKEEAIVNSDTNPTVHGNNEAESIGVALIAIDDAFTSHTEGAELAALGQRWDDAMKRIRPSHVPRLNGVLRREAAPFRIGEDGEVKLIQTREKDTVA